MLASEADNGWDVEFEPSTPSNSKLHYRDPVTYTDMLDAVASLELEKLTAKLNSCVCCAIQVDGSVD